MQDADLSVSLFYFEKSRDKVIKCSFERTSTVAWRGGGEEEEEAEEETSAAGTDLESSQQIHGCRKLSEC